MITLKLAAGKFVVMAMLCPTHNKARTYVITTPTGDRVEKLITAQQFINLEAALAAGAIYFDLS